MTIMKLVIVEDDPLFAKNLSLLLAGAPEMEIMALFANGEDALASLGESAPDILLVDLGLPGMSGIEFIKRAKEKLPEVEVMVLTVFEDRDRIISALKAGASSYMLKASEPREFVQALRDLKNGGSPMSPRIARKIVLEFQSESIGEQYLLSHREKEIIKEIENGLAYKEIAAKLFISPHTVHAHIKKIYEKLHASNKRSALTIARRKGII